MQYPPLISFKLHTFQHDFPVFGFTGMKPISQPFCDHLKKASRSFLPTSAILLLSYICSSDYTTFSLRIPLVVSEGLYLNLSLLIVLFRISQHIRGFHNTSRYYAAMLNGFVLNARSSTSTTPGSPNSFMVSLYCSKTSFVKSLFKSLTLLLALPNHGLS